MSKLFMLLVGCKPAGRHIEQHDVFFGVGESVKDLITAINDFWPAVTNKFHIDAWREVTNVDGYRVSVTEKENSNRKSSMNLYFINLGGYRPGEFEEYHYKMIAVATDKEAAIRTSKQTAFYQHTGFKTAASHVDDKYGIDVDDAYEIKNILPVADRDRYNILLSPAPGEAPHDIVHPGYFTISSFK